MNDWLSAKMWQRLCRYMEKKGVPSCRTEFRKVEKRIMRLARIDARHTIGTFAAFTNECFDDLDTMTNAEKHNALVTMLGCVSKDMPINPFVWADMCQILASMSDGYGC